MSSGRNGLAPIRTEEPSLLLMLHSTSDRRNGNTDFNPADFQFDIPNTPDIASVTKIVPLYVNIPKDYIGVKPDTVFVTMDGQCGGNMVDSGTGVVHEVLCGFSTNKSQNGRDSVFEASDMFTWDIDYHSPRDMSRVHIRLVDQNMEQLTLDYRTNVTLVLKLFHRAFVR